MDSRSDSLLITIETLADKLRRMESQIEALQEENTRLQKRCDDLEAEKRWLIPAQEDG